MCIWFVYAFSKVGEGCLKTLYVGQKSVFPHREVQKTPLKRVGWEERL